MCKYVVVYGMQNGDDALSSIILAGQRIFVKMLIPLELHHVFWSIFAYLYIFSEISRENDIEKKNKYKEKNVILRIYLF